MAKEVFGVSRELAELVAKATDSQLRHMSGTTVTHFTLRFAPSIIEEILDDSREELTHPVLKKLQQSLQGRGRWGTVAKLAMRQPFVLFKGLTFQ
ncbi:hypothetical protein, partial [Salmonella enterica]|uniref:hypothetical protein n=1 Tax=Salmonella enterica TaxID=28901 RepID=UPI003D2F6448